jgi:dTDP-4-amino-4,6-dideoxygalactose transaminase
MIASLDLTSGYEELRTEQDRGVRGVLKSGSHVVGSEVEAFGRESAPFCGAAHAIGVGSDLDALTLVLRALEIGPDRIATWLVVSQVGAQVVPVEPRPGTWNLDAARVAAAIASRAKAIVPIHSYGQACEIGTPVALARQNGLAVIEDAAQAHGSEPHGHRVGAHCEAVCWSFYPGKNLGTFGDGAVTTGRSAVAERVRVIGNYGRRLKYCTEISGTNSTARRSASRIASRQTPQARRMEQPAAKFGGAIPRQGLQSTKEFVLRVVAPGSIRVWHLFGVDRPERDRRQMHLKERGIGT